MAAKSKIGISGQKLFTPGKPKKSRQGNGKNSKASHGRKLRKGQGK
jgi:hypothetical protein